MQEQRYFPSLAGLRQQARNERYARDVVAKELTEDYHGPIGDLYEEVKQEYFVSRILTEKVYTGVLAVVIQPPRDGARFKVVKHMNKNKETGEQVDSGRSFLQMKVGDGPWETQAILFSKDKWSSEQVNEWLKKHEIKFKEIKDGDYSTPKKEKAKKEEQDEESAPVAAAAGEAASESASKENRLVEQIDQPKRQLSEAAAALGAQVGTLKLGVHKISPEVWTLFLLIAKKAIASGKHQITPEEAKEIIKSRLPTLIEFAQGLGVKPTEQDIKYGALLLAKELGLKADVIKKLIKEDGSEPSELVEFIDMATVDAWLQVFQTTIQMGLIAIKSYMTFATTDYKIAASVIVIAASLSISAIVNTALAGVAATWSNFKWNGRFWKMRTVAADKVIWPEETPEKKEKLHFLHPGEEYWISSEAATKDPYHPDAPYEKLLVMTPFTFLGFVAAPRWSNNYQALIRPKSGSMEDRERLIDIEDILSVGHDKKEGEESGEIHPKA